jgi:hypothetical protein
VQHGPGATSGEIVRSDIFIILLKYEERYYQKGSLNSNPRKLFPSLTPLHSHGRLYRAHSKKDTKIVGTMGSG